MDINAHKMNIYKIKLFFLLYFVPIINLIHMHKLLKKYIYIYIINSQFSHETSFIEYMYNLLTTALVVCLNGHSILISSMCWVPRHTFYDNNNEL